MRRSTRIARLFALYRLGLEYHSGQWSQGYRIHCKASTALRRLGIFHPWDINPRSGYGPHRWSHTFRTDVGRQIRRYRAAFKRNG